uniref:NcMCP7, putative n=1 Tax=Neospora caninum (strain Liverpool) TaxID=572307 RepID=A0A0F7UL61_NEOCL|nr:TPA: NcMCP7, putative [Neospora caninum Liverpool]
MTFNFLCIGSAVLAVATSSQAVHALERNLAGSIENDAMTSASLLSEDQMTVTSALQLKLDTWCTEEFARLCATNLPTFCNHKAVARFGKGNKSQKNDVWRCYEPSKLQSTKREVQCVDNCGNYVPCLGSVNPSTTIHASRHSEILNFLQQQVSHFCSPIQKAADDFCNRKTKGSVARKALAHAGQSAGGWNCENTGNLTFETVGLCADNCGKDEECVGGPNSQGDSNQHGEDSDLNTFVKQQSNGCSSGGGCLSTPVNPPLCLDGVESGTHAESATESDHDRIGEIEFLCRGDNEPSCSQITKQKMLCPASSGTGGFQCLAAAEPGSMLHTAKLKDCILCKR